MKISTLPFLPPWAVKGQTVITPGKRPAEVVATYYNGGWEIEVQWPDQQRATFRLSVLTPCE